MEETWFDGILFFEMVNVKGKKKKKFKNKKLVLHILEVNGIVTNSNKLWGVLSSL